jgi:hypothetical protein
MGELTQGNTKDKYSLQNAVNKLAIILKLIFEDNPNIFLKKPEEVSVDLLNNFSNSFISISTLFQEVIEEWFGSSPEVFEAINRPEELGDQLEIEVRETDKLDFEHIRRIMNRMNKIDDALGNLEKISLYLKYYEDLSKQKGLTSNANLSEIFRVYGVEEFARNLRNEINHHKNQIERNNMYNRAKLNTKTLKIATKSLKIAYAALVISVLFAIFTLLDLLLKYIVH